MRQLVDDRNKMELFNECAKKLKSYLSQEKQSQDVIDMYKRILATIAWSLKDEYILEIGQAKPKLLQLIEELKREYPREE